MYLSSDSDGALEYLEKALKQFPTLLTLEDFVSKHGTSWGISETTINVAVARVQYFDLISGMPRYT